MGARYGPTSQALSVSLSGFVTDKIEPWEENGETQHLLRVAFPDNIASDLRDQITYFGADGLMPRHDYAVDVLGGVAGAHYIDGYHQVDGIMVPHRRRVHPRGVDNHRVPVLASTDIAHIGFRS